MIFDIAGMRCGACTVGIDLTLGKKKGVKIAKAVKDLGYIATQESKPYINPTNTAKFMFLTF